MAMTKGDASLGCLSSREREVLDLLGKGLSNQEAAGILGLSVNTVKVHVANLLRKLEVSNRTEAVGLVTAARGAPSPQSRDIPAIAVMPFRSEGQTPEELRQSDGIVDDLITRLGTRWFPVIARCSTYALYNKQASDAREIGTLLRARFLVEGDYRSLGKKLRLNVRLIDAESGRIIWAQGYDRSIDDLFEVQFDLSVAIVHAVAGATIEFVAGETARLPSPSLAPWELAVRGLSLFWKGTSATNREARQVFESALKQEPNLRLALYGQGLSYQRAIVEQWEEPRASVLELHRAARTFNEHYPDDAWARLISAYAAIYSADAQGAENHVKRALALEPSSLRGRSLHGQLLAMRGEVRDAVDQLEVALRLSPLSPARWTVECALALAYFAAEDYAACVPWAERAAKADNAGVMPFGVLASSLAHLGDQRAASQAMARVVEKNPSFTTDQFRPMVASTRPDIAERFIAGLAKARTDAAIMA